jgi:hypothetical protein
MQVSSTASIDPSSILHLDLWYDICKYLSLANIYHLALVNRRFYHFCFKEDCSYIIRQGILSHRVKFQPSFSKEMIEYEAIPLRDLYLKNTLMFDTSTLSHLSSVIGKLNRTVKNVFSSKRSKWETIKASIPCTAGHIYEWSIKLDHYNPNQNSNFWVLIAGIQDDNFRFRRIDSQVFGEWLARTGNGIGYIFHSREWITNNSAQSVPKSLGFIPETGDYISFRLDMTYSSVEHDALLKRLVEHSFSIVDWQTKVSKWLEDHPCMPSVGATLQMYYNGEPVLQSPFRGIYGQQLYPTVSIIDQQQVTIKPGIHIRSEKNLIKQSQQRRTELDS